MWFAELSIDALTAMKRSTPIVQTPTVFPPVKRDLSVLIKQDVPFEAVDRAIRDVAGTLASRVELIDRFSTGSQLPAGTYSLTFSIEYRDPARTLTAAEADALHRRITDALASRFGATLR